MVFEKSLTAMVKGIRAHRGKETEYISSCVQEIQKEVTSKNLATKSQAVLKLAYLSMLGYDMSWATFAVVEVMAHNRFAAKRPGYLASAMSFTESTEVGLLTINLFKKDFGSKSQYESGMALTCLSSICSPEICKDLINDLLAMLSSSRPYLRKKTVLCLYRVFLKDPPALRTCFPKLRERLADEDQGVLTATVNTFLELTRKNAKNYLSLVPQLYHILVNTTNNWLSIKLLKVFQLLIPMEPRLPAKMVEPLTNLLNTTKAQSVEFEVIRCTVRAMPEGTSLMSLAMEKLQHFLNSSDRNLRFLALELCQEILQKPQFKEKFAMPELHTKVLESIEESDSTARKVALQLLDQIVTPSTFSETVKKLMEISKKCSQPDEFVGTILRLGARDRYALLEDFAMYLLVLADLGRHQDSEHGEEVAEQMIDISVRVPQVRPYAVMLALKLLDHTTAVASASDGSELLAPGSVSSGGAIEGMLDLAQPVVGACAWLVGEYHVAFEGAAAEASMVTAARALLVPKYIQALQPAIQAQCIWAAAKLYLGAAKHAPGAVSAPYELLCAQLPVFTQSTHVDVAERAALAFQLASHCKEDVGKITECTGLVQDELVPVQAGAQAALALPEGLDLEELFFPAEAVAPEEASFMGVKADPKDPYSLAANYKDDLGFLTKPDAEQQVAAPAQSSANSMFYLQSRDDGAGSDAKEAAVEGAAAASSGAVDPLAQMRDQLLAARASGAVKYEVNRDDMQAPMSTGGVPAGAPNLAAAQSGGRPAQFLPPISEKELTELQGRLWTMTYRDDCVGVYACVRAKNVRKQLLRIDLRCERLSQEPAVTGVFLKLPTGVVAQEADANGFVTLVPGELQERSAKVKVNINLAPFVAPVSYPIACELRYQRSGSAEPSVGSMEVRLPATCVLLPVAVSEDDMAAYMAQHSGSLGPPVGQSLNLTAPGRSVEALAESLPMLMARCASLCHFHGFQNQSSDPSQNKGQKFMLVAQPPPLSGVSPLAGQEALPAMARVLCMCNGVPRPEALDLTIKVRSCRPDVSEEVCAQLASTFRELHEGRLRVEGLV